MLILIAVGAFGATLLGGFFAFRFKDKLHLILGFSAGAVVGVSLFDLIPESLEISKNFWADYTVMLVIAFGFIFYMILDRFLLTHCDDEDHHHRGRFGASSLSFHSFLDGIAIGVAFQISAVVGLIIGTAVLVHNFLDGVNTASLIMHHGGDRKQVLKWVLIDALAPALGIFSTLFFSIAESFFGLILAFFAGTFLYIGASDLLPESHHSHPTFWTTASTIFGMTLIYFIIRLVGV